MHLISDNARSHGLWLYGAASFKYYLVGMATGHAIALSHAILVVGDPVVCTGFPDKDPHRQVGHIR